MIFFSAVDLKLRLLKEFMLCSLGNHSTDPESSQRHCSTPVGSIGVCCNQKQVTDCNQKQLHGGDSKMVVEYWRLCLHTPNTILD